MRHRNKGRKLGRMTGPRKALTRNLATAVILYEKVETTEAKAKHIRPVVERLITTAKSGTVLARRRLAAKLMHPNAVRKAVEVLGPRYKDRRGGYTRIIKLNQRKGDAAWMARIELV